MDLRAKCAIAGLGQTRMGKNFDHPNAMGFAAEAIKLALDDAGLKREDLDGLLVNPGITWAENTMASFSLQQAMGLRDLRLSATMGLGGATAGAMIMHAAQSIACGMANTVACVFADAPLKPPAPKDAKGKSDGGGSAAAYGFARGLNAAYGQFGVNAHYAFVARRHMDLYGTTQDHLGAIAVEQRKWATMNPEAQFHDAPMTMADYHSSRWIVEPFHLYDCCLVSNGGCAVIVTSAERAKSLKKPPVYLLGMGQDIPAVIRWIPCFRARQSRRRPPSRWQALRYRTCSLRNFMIAIPSRFWLHLKTTASARRARAGHSLPMARPGRAVRCLSTQGADS